MKTIELKKDESGRFSILDNALVELNSTAGRIATIGASVVTSAYAYATEPTYTSQIGSALTTINMTAIVTDVAAFAAVGFTLLLTTKGVLFASKLLSHFLR